MHKNRINIQKTLRQDVFDWQVKQLENATQRLFNFLEAIEKRRLAIMQHFDNDEAFQIRLNITVMLNYNEGCIEVVINSGIVIGNNSPVQPLNLFWGMEKVEEELCKCKAADLHTSKINIPIFDDILTEMNGDFCDYMKKNSVNYTELGFIFRKDCTYRVKVQLDDKTSLYENGINNYTTLVH